MKNKIIHIYNKIINLFSFYNEIHKIRRKINSISIDKINISNIPKSHPRGFIKEFQKRRVTIVELYLYILNNLSSEKYNDRLKSLRLIYTESFHSKALKMPLNTARVQIALMKMAIKEKHNKRKQLEYIRDFSISSYGLSNDIRRYLKILDIIEVPETGEQLKDLNLGWDHHVHDNSSYGRKNPCQLLLDAFIKGLSEITIVYNSISHPEIISEAVEAGNILGIKVNIGLEFSEGKQNKRYHYIFKLNNISNAKELKKYFSDNKEKLNFLTTGLEKNQKNRIESLKKLINNFNKIFLPNLNQDYQKNSIYYIKPIKN